MSAPKKAVRARVMFWHDHTHTSPKQNAAYAVHCYGPKVEVSVLPRDEASGEAMVAQAERMMRRKLYVQFGLHLNCRRPARAVLESLNLIPKARQ